MAMIALSDRDTQSNGNGGRCVTQLLQQQINGQCDHRSYSNYHTLPPLSSNTRPRIRRAVSYSVWAKGTFTTVMFGAACHPSAVLVPLVVCGCDEVLLFCGCNRCLCLCVFCVCPDELSCCCFFLSGIWACFAGLYCKSTSLQKLLTPSYTAGDLPLEFGRIVAPFFLIVDMRG